MLEILDTEGTVVNAFRSAEDGEADDSVTVVDDMSLNQTRFLENETLSTDVGLNRFHWDMTWRGAWHEDEDERFEGGPLAAPGTYTLRLTAGDTVVETSLTIVADPRIADIGVTNAMLDEQVELELVRILGHVADSSVVGVREDPPSDVARLPPPFPSRGAEPN